MDAIKIELTAPIDATTDEITYTGFKRVAGIGYIYEGEDDFATKTAQKADGEAGLDTLFPGNAQPA